MTGLFIRFDTENEKGFIFYERVIRKHSEPESLTIMAVAAG